MSFAALGNTCFGVVTMFKGIFITFRSSVIGSSMHTATDSTLYRWRRTWLARAGLSTAYILNSGLHRIVPILKLQRIITHRKILPLPLIEFARCNIANNSFATIIDIEIFNSDFLLSFTTITIEAVHLHSVGTHEFIT